jgi:glycosyltransferase involved in cell wall biosynthesis
MPHVYSLVDVYALPSISENCPMSLLEAMSCETPVIAGCAGGNPEIIESGKNGLLIPPKDSMAIARAILTVLKDRKYASRLAQKGRRTIANEKSSERIGGVLIEACDPRL